MLYYSCKFNFKRCVTYMDQLRVIAHRSHAKSTKRWSWTKCANWAGALTISTRSSERASYICAFPAKMLKCYTLNNYPRFPAPTNAPAKFLEESFSKITREFSVHARASARSAMYLAPRINWSASHQCVQCSDLELHFGIRSPAANTYIVVILSLVYANRCKVLKF